MGRSTLSVQDETKERFDGLKDGESQDGFLNTLLDAYEEDTTQETVEHAESVSKHVERLERRMRSLEEQVETVPRDTADYLR